MRHFVFGSAVLLSLLCGRPVLGDGSSGLAAGADIPSLKVAAVAGLVTNDERDFAAERSEQPTVYAFVQADKWDRPIARFLATLDRQLAKDRSDVQIIAVWLTDDVAKSKEYLPKAQQSLNLSQTVWSVFPGDKSGPQGWNIDSGPHITVVVADGKKAVASFDYRSVNEIVVPDVLRKLPAKK